MNIYLRISLEDVMPRKAEMTLWPQRCYKCVNEKVTSITKMLGNGFLLQTGTLEEVVIVLHFLITMEMISSEPVATR